MDIAEREQLGWRFVEALRKHTGIEVSIREGAGAYAVVVIQPRRVGVTMNVGYEMLADVNIDDVASALFGAFVEHLKERTRQIGAGEQDVDETLIDL